MTPEQIKIKKLNDAWIKREPVNVMTQRNRAKNMLRKQTDEMTVNAIGQNSWARKFQSVRG